ncbi:MAG: aminotransferase class I/II-fold pyridoxal phosphate-dependent enzyme [Chloroflexota bacterium]
MTKKLASLHDLALFGGSPLFTAPLHVGRPNLVDKDLLLERFNDIFHRLWFTNNGHYQQEFERSIRQYTGVKHCFATCNGTVALEIAVRALGLSGEVIVPAFTFIATAHALQWLGIKPVFCDVDAETHNLDPRQVERLIGPRTTGIIGVHLWGRACDVDALCAVADKHRLRILFDSAHAFGCTYKGRKVGHFGDAEVFSFHATKFVNSFEGGAVVTNNDDLAEEIGLMRNFGFSGYDQVIRLGINGKMTEVCAAMGLTSLEGMHEVVAANTRNYQLYREEIESVPGLTLVPYDSREQCNYQYIVVRVDAAQTLLSRDDLVDILHEEGVLARRYFTPGCHRMEPYASDTMAEKRHLPVTERLCNEILVLPTGLAVTEDNIRAIGQLLRFAVENAEGILVKIEEYNAADRKL